MAGGGGRLGGFPGSVHAAREDGLCDARRLTPRGLHGLQLLVDRTDIFEVLYELHHHRAIRQGKQLRILHNNSSIIVVAVVSMAVRVVQYQQQ